MKLAYRLAYALGFFPWERVATYPPAVRQIALLLAAEEHGRDRPFGRALELGCGRGHGSIVLARRGWQVTGIDFVGSALRAARRAARAANVEIDFRQADLERLAGADLGAPFRLFWDFGVLHGMRQAARVEIARQLTARAAPGAAALLFAWPPGRRGPLPRGMSRAEIESAFHGWPVTGVQPFAATGLPRPFLAVEPQVYRLQLSAAAPAG